MRTQQTAPRSQRTIAGRFAVPPADAPVRSRRRESRVEEKKFALEMQGAGRFSPRPCSSWPNFFYGKRQRPLTTSRIQPPQTPTLSAGEKSPSCRAVTTAADPRDFSPCLPGEGRSPCGTFGGAVSRLAARR